MDVTPINVNDSGYNSSTVSSSLNFNSYESVSKSRKRKLSNILEEKKSYCNDSCFEESTHNSSCFQDDSQLTASLEKCSLDECYSPKKKHKWNETEKSSSEPGTPQKKDYFELRKYCSLDLTPKKEKLELLYPKIHQIKSPEKIRNEIKRLCKPKKRLFHCRDFVYIFTQVEKVDHIIGKIFSYLPEMDLINVAKVSKLWKRSLEIDEKSHKRYKIYLENITNRKENIYEGNLRKLLRPVPQNVAVSPGRVNWAKFASVGAVLDQAERLIKCVICERPAILKRRVARCSGTNCGYLWCVGCFAGASIPELIDCCCKTPHSPPSPLRDTSNRSEEASSYFLNESISVGGPSGYFDPEKVKPHVLTDCNDNISKKTSNMSSNSFNILEHRDKIHKAKKNLSSRRNHASEPGSPPQVKISAAGSKQSKRNLRRLLY